MQVNFNPMPATGDVMTAEASPATSLPAAEVQADGARRQSVAADSQKGFRETMDDLLRSAESGEVNGDDQAASDTPEASEASDAELALLEMQASPHQPQQNGRAGLPCAVATKGHTGEGEGRGKTQAGQFTPPRADSVQADLPSKGADDASTPARGNGGAAPGPIEPLNSALRGDGSESPKPVLQGESTVFQDISTPRKGAAERVSNQTVVDPKAAAQLNPASEPRAAEELKAAAELKAVAEPKAAADPKDASGPRASVAVVDTANSEEASAVLLKASRSGNLQEKGPKNGSSQAQTDRGVTAGQLLGNAVRASHVQDRPGQEANQNATNVARAVSMNEPAAKKTQAQGFATLVESIEKGGAEAKPVNPVADNPLDTAGASATKQTPNTLSTLGNVAKADAAAPQSVTKEEVIQQIVDSAKLRLQNGQGEMRIQLKPESMGHVRLNISTDQHQVMIKVVAELPAVKELLESNLPLLRAELQGQGLEIDKFDVSISGDSEPQSREQQNWAQRRNGRRGGGAFAQGDPENPEEHRDSQHNRQFAAESESDRVDYFA